MSGPPGLRFRPARLTDFEDLLFIEEQAHVYCWPESTLQWCLEQAHLRVFVLEQHQLIVGFCVYECILDEATLLNIAVHPEHQGRGYGRQLLQQSLLALDASITRILLEVRVSNAPAIALYTSEGFHEIGYRKGYYPSLEGREDARVMARERQPAP